MYLKRLEIQGFKSFANKTILEFFPPKNGRFSVTAVVGPNGAGKSNISDAIRWVMGEQSLKVLRGKKSEDVIFGGSETKGQLGAAEVSLVLDNSDGKTMTEYPEISITRRVYRSGEGEYLVNNNPARLFDVHLLLAKAQFGQHSYSVVGQGMIDRLLLVSPAERKDFLDEASGIKEFQIKRHQADLKLSRTHENMAQAERLLAEVEPRLRLLARQVKKLEKRQEVELKLRETQESYYATVWNHNQNEMSALKNTLETVEANYRKIFAELESVQTELASLARATSRQEVFVELQNRHQEAMRAKNELERQLAILDGQMHMEYSQAGKQNIGWLENKIKELQGSQSKLSNQLSQAHAEADRLSDLVTKEKKVLDDLTADKTQLVLKISRLQSEMMSGQSEQNYLQFSGLTAVKAVMESKSRFGKVHGLVAELGEVDEEYRQALEVAAGSNLSSIVVEDEKTARLAINFLRENRLGVATFLPLNKIQSRAMDTVTQSLLAEPGVIGLAIDLVRYSNKYTNIFSFIFGSTLVVKDLLAAEKIGIGSARMVTLSGDLVERNGVMKGGFRQRKNNVTFSSKISLNGETRLADFQAEISLEQQNLADLDRKIESAKTNFFKAQVDSQSALARANMLEEDNRNAEKEIANLERELEVLQATPEEYGEKLKTLAGKKGSLLAEMETDSTAISKLALEIEDFNRKEEEKKQRIFTLQNEMQSKQELVNGILAERNELKIQLAKLETKQEDLTQEVWNDMNVAVNSIIERNPAVVEKQELSAIADEIQRLKYQLSLIGGIDEEVTKEYEETKEKYEFLSDQLADLNKATDDLSGLIKELDEEMKKKRSASFKKIRKEFDRYFQILFGGGSAKLEEIYGEPEAEEDPLPEPVELKGEAVVYPAEPEGRSRDKVLTGIDIIVNPPGKRIRNISALSGGERTLTSIALICAILNNNPSPFVLLDEVEAALDEANTGHFVRIMSELATQSQFIIITHNRVTMHAADALYGVVMGGDGISKLLSVKMEEAERFDQPPPVDKMA